MDNPKNQKTVPVKKPSQTINATVDKNVKAIVKTPEKPVTKPKKKNLIPMILATILLTATLVSIGIFVIKPMMIPATESTTLKGEMTDAGYVIPMDMVSNKPNFYPMNVDNVKVEILALKASDGSIRTAFNTCQVCYSSGRGYYKWIDGKLVCQNCGNKFTPDQVEVTKGGCNPVPIYDEETKVENGKITVPIEFLRQAIVVFRDWKI